MDASRPSAPPPSPLLRASEVLLKYLLNPPTSSSSWDLLPQVLPQVLSWPSASAYRISSAVVMSRGSRVQLVRRAPRDCPPRAKIRAGFFLPQTSFEARSRLSSLVHGVTSRRRPLTRRLDLDGCRVTTLRTFSAGSVATDGPRRDQSAGWFDSPTHRGCCLWSWRWRTTWTSSSRTPRWCVGTPKTLRPDPICADRHAFSHHATRSHVRRRSSGWRTTCFTRSR